MTDIRSSSYSRATRPSSRASSRSLASATARTTAVNGVLYGTSSSGSASSSARWTAWSDSGGPDMPTPMPTPLAPVSASRSMKLAWAGSAGLRLVSLVSSSSPGPNHSHGVGQVRAVHPADLAVEAGLARRQRAAAGAAA